MRQVARDIPVEAPTAAPASAIFAVRSGPTLKDLVCSGQSCPFRAGCPRVVPHLTKVVPTTPGQPRPVQDLPTSLRGTPWEDGTMITCQFIDVRAWSSEKSLRAALDNPKNLFYT